METKKEEIQKHIKTLLKTMTPEEIAVKLETTTMSLWRYENGKIASPHYRILKRLRKLEKILGGK